MIHATSVIDKSAEIDSEANIGPFCFIEKNSVIKKGVKLLSHVYVGPNTTIDENTSVASFVSLGEAPQDLTYKGEDTYLKIGKNCNIFDGTVISRGSTKSETRTTVIGDNCFFMSHSHVGHDGYVCDGAMIGAATTVAGHCYIGRGAILSAHIGMHQFVRVGPFAMISSTTRVGKDCPPYFTVWGFKATIGAMNTVGLRRAGFSRDEINKAREIYRIYTDQSLLTKEAFDKIEATCGDSAIVKEFLAFGRGESKRGFIRALKSNLGGDSDE